LLLSLCCRVPVLYLVGYMYDAAEVALAVVVIPGQKLVADGVVPAIMNVGCRRGCRNAEKPGVLAS